MHPVFSHVKNLLAVVGLWLILSGLISYLLYFIQDIEKHVALVLYFPLLFIYLFFCLANYYICKECPMRQTSFPRLVTTQFVAVASTVLIWLVCGYLYVFLLNEINPGDWLLYYRSSTTSLGIMGAILYCFWILAHYIYLMAEQHDAMQRAALEHKLLISQTELQAVKATVHPHFLYNSLNTLANLSLVEPRKIHNICLQISEFLRYSVSYGQKETATVGEELEHVQNYLGIERERFGDRLRTEFRVDESTRSEPILPLLLFPLVENSIKHGIDSSLNGGTLEITVGRDGGNLCIHIHNPYDELGVKQNGTNLGLDAVRKRIQAHYGDQGQVAVERNSGIFSVHLILPVRRRLQ
jgi:two-component system, LytTR family, sensor kinase